ncbi:hypothetical protein L3X38_008552 [Prunus dulcis]|uniref:Uncharacterized protein n=1 Tax=Prunus dulcis TaxID=3755 RepID=A0AAD4ZWN1_PRUDU|nr:hypothetical protein L3X38_008552 [Prunus dulcis]
MGINPQNPRSNFGVFEDEKLTVAVLGGGEYYWDRGLEVLARSCKRLRRLRIERGADEQGMEDEEGVVSQKGLIALAQGCLELEYLMKKVGPLLSGVVFWCPPLSGPMSR